MKYFTRELWKAMNYGDDREKRRAEAQWDCNAAAYETYINSIKNRKIKQFLDKMDQLGELHDYDVTLINYVPGRSTCDIFLSDCRKEYRLHFFGVSSICADMADLKLDFSKLRMGYFEFELLKNRQWHMSIAFDFENEMEITADGVKLKEIER